MTQFLPPRNNWLRLLCLILAVTLILSACGGSQDDPDETSVSSDTDVAVTTDPQRLTPDLPEITFNDEEFIMYRYVSGGHHWNDLYAEELNGEPVNDAVFKRNQAIEEQYAVDLVYIEEQYTTFNDNLKATVMADDDSYDLVFNMGHTIAHNYAFDLYYNLHQVPYLDFDKPWWDHDSVENFTMVGYLPFAAADICILNLAAAQCVYFNQKLVEDLQLGNLYQYVLENNWTMDTFIQLGKQATADLNGDTVMDENDRYGMVCNDGPMIPLFHATDARFLEHDKDGYPQLSFMTDKNVTAIQYFLEKIMFTKEMTFNTQMELGYSTTLNPIKLFTDGHGLFMINLINSTNMLREMTADYGILPIPKYDANQENYSSSTSVFAGSLVSILKTERNLERAGILLEALSAESHYELFPAFYETVLKGKLTRDVESAQMLDIIKGSLVFDVGDYLSLATFSDYFLRLTGSVYNDGNSAFPERTTDIASFYAMYEGRLEAALEDLHEILNGWK